MIKPFKYMLQPVAIEYDAEGKILREVPAETISVYSTEQAVEAIQKFEQSLLQLASNQNGAGP